MPPLAGSGKSFPPISLLPSAPPTQSIGKCFKLMAGWMKRAGSAGSSAGFAQLFACGGRTCHYQLTKETNSQGGLKFPISNPFFPATGIEKILHNGCK